MRIVRKRFLICPEEVRPDSFSVSTRFTFPVSSTGAKPASRPHVREMALTKAKIVQSGLMVLRRARLSGRMASSSFNPSKAMASASAPARQQINRLSHNSCRPIRHLVAPIATRKAISLRRVLARVSRRFATLKQETSRTRPAPMKSAMSAGLISRTTSWCSPTTSSCRFSTLYSV